MALITYQLVQVLEPNRIIVARRAGFGKDLDNYKKLEDDLKNDWKIEKHKRKSYRESKQVMISLLEMQGFKRAVVCDKLNLPNTECGDIYTVFSYDDGKYEDVDEKHLKHLRECRKVLPPRTLVMTLPGVVPAKQIVDPLAKMFKKPSALVTRSSDWTRASSQKVKEWLDNDQIEYLAVDIVIKKNECFAVGDILRKLKQPAPVPSSSDEPKGNKFESLTTWLVENHLALISEDLRTSQLYQGSLGGTPEQELKQAFREDELKKATQVPPSSLVETSEELSSSATSAADSEDSDLAFHLKLMQMQAAPDYLVSAAWQNPKDLERNEDKIDRKRNENDVPGSILTRGSLARPPYRRLEDFQLPDRILEAVKKMGITELSDLQKTVAPNFVRMNDIMIVSPDGGGLIGKSVRVSSYILPLLRLIYHHYEQVRAASNACSPEAIIVVKSFNIGSDIEGFIKKLLSFSQHLSLCVKFHCKDVPIGDSENQRHFVERKILPGEITILITTNNYLAEILKTRAGSRLLTRLKYIVFEEMEQYLSAEWKQVVDFIELAKETVKSTSSHPYQLVLSSSKWTPQMDDIYHVMCTNRTPVVVIKGINEAIRYAKVRWIVHHVQENEKISKLNELFLTDCSPINHRVLIACSTPSVARKVSTAILNSNSRNFSTLELTEECSLESRSYALSNWRKRNSNVLVISDDMIHNVDVTDGTRLICFDSPEIIMKNGAKRPVAAERFGYLWSNIRSIEDDWNRSNLGTTPTVTIPDGLQAHFLLTGDEHNFHVMCKFAMSLDTNVLIPKSLEDKVLQKTRSGEDYLSLCDSFKLFGFCSGYDKNTCPCRHEFSKNDLTEKAVAPVSGEIEVRIKKCENASQYRAQLLRHYVFQNGKRIVNTSYISQYTRRCEILSKYCEGESGKSRPEPLAHCPVGAWCCVRDPEKEKFTRAQVFTSHGPIVQVFCVDLGISLNPMPEEIFPLPEEYQKWPPLVVDLILCNLKPLKGELEYRSGDRKAVRVLTVENIFNAKVCLSLGNTVWVNPMVEYKLDKITQQTVKGISVRIELITKKLAEFNRDHLNNLFTSVKRYEGLYQGMTEINEYQLNNDKLYQQADEFQLLKNEFHQLGDDYQWAFIEMNTANKFLPAKIATTYGYDPWLFYGTHVKYENELNRLEKELDQCIQNHISGGNGSKHELEFEKYPEFFQNYYEPEMIVAAKERVAGTWMRAKIISKTEDKEVDPLNEGSSKVQGKSWFKVFFVDYGDTSLMSTDELFPIPRKFINRLPFQAIGLKLAHIHPPTAEPLWTPNESTAFVDIIIPDLVSVDLDLVATGKAEKEVSEVEVPCRYYNVVALHGDGELGSIVVKKGLATWIPGKEEEIAEIEKKFLEFYNVTVDSELHLDEEDDEDEKSSLMDSLNLEEPSLGDANFDFGSFPVLDDDESNNNGRDAAVRDPMDFDIYLNTEGNGIGSMMENFFGSPGPQVASSSNRSVPRLELPGPPASRSVPGPAIPHQGCILDAPTPEAASKYPPSMNQPVPSTSRSSLGSSTGRQQSDSMLCPETLWKQTDTHFILTIRLVDIKEYQINIGTDRQALSFRTIGDPVYGFNIRLYGKVTEHTTYLTGQYLRITFTKRMGGFQWFRALYDKETKYRWLKEDLTALVDKDDSEDENKYIYTRGVEYSEEGNKGSDSDSRNEDSSDGDPDADFGENDL